MDKKKIELIITGILVIIFIFAVSNIIRKARPKMTKSSQPSSGSVSPAGPPDRSSIISRAGQTGSLFKPKVKELIEEKEGIKEEREWGRDPFNLHEADQSGGIDSITSLKLMGITVGEKTKSMAIINNEIVSIGSKIGKFTVLKIAPGKVIVTDGQTNYELKISQ